MQSLSIREKVLIASNAVLAIFVFFLMYKVIGYNLNVFNFEYEAPQTMETSIKSSNLHSDDNNE